MSHVQPHSGVLNPTLVFFSQQPNRPSDIRTRINGCPVQKMVTSVPKSVTQTGTKKLAADKEIIVLSSDSESDTETRRVVSRKMKGKDKMKNEALKTSTSIIDHTTASGVNRSSVVNDDSQCVNIDSLSNNATISKSTQDKNKKNLHVSTSNKENLTLFQLLNPVKKFLDILEAHKTNAGLFEIVIDFTRIYLEIYDEDKRIITDLQDFPTLVANLVYCLSSKLKDINHVATSKRFKQVESLSRRTMEVIDKSKITGEKNIEDYGKAKLHNKRKRKVKEEISSQEKRRKLDDDGRSVDEKGRTEMDRQDVRRREEQRRQEEHEKELVRKKCEEFENLMIYRNNSSTKINEAELKLLAEPLHDLIAAQIVYNSYRNFAPCHLSETVSRCGVSKLFKFNHFERAEYCKQLYLQYMNANMDDTTKILESWIKVRVSEIVKSRYPGYRAGQ